MKITLIAERFPYPMDRGDRLTIFHLVKYLSERHQVSLITFTDPNHDPEWEAHLQPYCERLETLPIKKWRSYLNCALGIFDQVPLQVHYNHDPAMARLVNRVISETKPDLLYAHYIRTGRYTVEHVQIPRVLAMQLSMTLNYKRLAEYAPTWFHKMLYTIELKKLQKFEANFARRFDKVMLISQHDLNAIAPEPPLTNVFFNPHGVDSEYFSEDPDIDKEPNSLIFTGNMRYMPNVDAVTYFCKEILPTIRQRIPDVKFYIVGTDPLPEVLALGKDPSIIVTGRVPDLRTYLNRAQVAVAPMRIVAGLLNKLLESMAMALPIVVTSKANEGIKAHEGDHVLIADTPEEFANHVIDLLGDPQRRFDMGKAGRDYVLTEWSWEYHLKDLEEMFVELVDSSSKTANPEPSGLSATTVDRKS